MSANLTDYGANAFGDHLSGVATLPSTFYVALCSTQPDVGVDGTTLDALEPAGASYARVALARNGATSWQAADLGVITTLVDVNFAVAAEDWGTITHYALCTAASAGYVYGYGQFTYEQRIMTGDQMLLPAGGISLSFVGPTNPMVL